MRRTATFSESSPAGSLMMTNSERSPSSHWTLASSPSRQAQRVLTANMCKHGGLPDISVRGFQNQRQATAFRRRAAQVSRRAPYSNYLEPLVLQPRQPSRHQGARAKLQEGWGGRFWLERQHGRPKRPRTDRQMSRRAAERLPRKAHSSGCLVRSMPYYSYIYTMPYTLVPTSFSCRTTALDC